MFFPGRKPIFHHANIEFFEILTKLSVSSLCLSLVYIYNTALSWFSKFSHSFASESLFSIPFFFSQGILKELLSSFALTFLLHKKLQGFNYSLSMCTLKSCYRFKLNTKKLITGFLVKLFSVFSSLFLLSP